MSNSSLVNYTRISPNRTSPRQDKIRKITIHHMAGNLSVETCGNVFAPSSRQASSNYGIDSSGRVGMYVEEKDRSWCSSSRANDNQAVTIEVADDVIGNGWHSSDAAMKKLVELCADICQRNGIKKLNYTGDTSGNLTMHKWFANTDCPGAYLEGKFPWIAEQVNKLLSGGSYTPPANTAPAPAKPSKPASAAGEIAELQAECNRQGFSAQKIDDIAGPITLAGCPMLKMGARGNITKWLQKRLNKLGFNCGTADGIFGAMTQAAIKAFQRAHNLVADGIVGPKTWSKLLGLS